MQNPELILIVDDESDIRETIILSNKLAHRKFKEAANGQEALDLLKTEKFDAVICDISMPKISGIELLKMTREIGIETPFVFLSGHAEEEILKRIENKGVVRFVEKIGIRKLPQVITDLLEKTET